MENIIMTRGVVTMSEVVDTLITERRLETKVELLIKMNFTVEKIAEKLGILKE